jgi:hypothetical protein
LAPKLKGAGAGEAIAAAGAPPKPNVASAAPNGFTGAAPNGLTGAASNTNSVASAVQHSRMHKSVSRRLKHKSMELALKSSLAKVALLPVDSEVNTFESNSISNVLIPFLAIFSSFKVLFALMAPASASMAR